MHTKEANKQKTGIEINGQVRANGQSEKRISKIKNFRQIAKFYLEMKCALLGAPAEQQKVQRLGEGDRPQPTAHSPQPPAPAPSEAAFGSFQSTFRNIILHLFAQRSYFFVFFRCFGRKK